MSIELAPDAEHLAGHAAEAMDDAAKKLHEQEARDRQVNAAIAAIENDPNLPQDVKAQLIADLRSGAAGGNLNAVMAKVAHESKEVAAEEALQDDIMYEMMENDYPDYADYSHEGRAYIMETAQRAFNDVPELKQMKGEYEGLPPELRAKADDELAENWSKYNAMKNDPAYEDYKQELIQMKRLGLLNSERGKELIGMVENHASHEELKAKIEEATVAHVKQAEPVVNSMIDRIDENSRDYLKHEFGKADGTVDTRKLVDAWAQTSTSERDAAYKAYAETHDITKLSPDQQKIIHMAQIMIPVEAAGPMQAAIDIVNRDPALAAKLTDKSMSQEQRGEILEAAALRQGYTGDRNLLDSAARNVIETFDNNPSAVDLIKKGDLKQVGAMYQASMLDDIGFGSGKTYNFGAATTGAAALGDQLMPGLGTGLSSLGNPNVFNPYSIDSVLAYNFHAQSEGEIPSWAKPTPKSAEQQAADNKSWRKMENDILAQYETAAPSPVAGHVGSDKKADAEHAVAAADAAPKSMRAMEEESMAKYAAMIHDERTAKGEAVPTPVAATTTANAENASVVAATADKSVIAPVADVAPAVVTPADATVSRKTETAVSETAAAPAPLAATEVEAKTAAVVAGTAFVPPPGLNLKDIPSLGALGVTGGDPIGGSQQAATQNVQMAKAPEQEAARTA